MFDKIVLGHVKDKNEAYHESSMVKQTIYHMITLTVYLGLTIYTLLIMPMRMNYDGKLDMVDVHGYVHQVSAEVHHNALGLAWGLFLGAIIINLVFYKLHPSMPDMNPTSDDKLQTHVCGTIWNINKCSCGSNEEVSDTTNDEDEDHGARNLGSFELQEV